MKKLVLGVFVLTALGIGVLIFFKPQAVPEQTRIITPQIVTAAHESAQQLESRSSAFSDDMQTLVSFMPLLANESLLQTLSVDFDKDGYEDQINAVRRGADPEIILLVGLYNAQRAAYERVEEVRTGITQASTFTYTCLDITGTHRNALVFQGFLPSGEVDMRIFHGTRSRNNFSLTTIGDFRSDGTIFIQRVDRYDSYETLGGAGTSYPVWVYSSDMQTAEAADDRARTLDQLQTMYDWDSSRGRYMRVRQNRVPGQRLAQSEIQRIQDGTVETFAGFLEGLWYRQGAFYVFFDYANRVVVFLSGGSQEIYSWESSTLRRNGIYLSTVNASISNLSRMVDVSLSGIEEINVRLRDDVRMIISENTSWDGVYTKVSRKNESTLMRKQTQNPAADILAALTAQKEWTTDSGALIQFARNNYALSAPWGRDEGRYALMVVLGRAIIEFRSKAPTPFLEKTYQIAQDGEAFKLEPVTISPSRITPNGTANIILRGQAE